MDLTVKTLTWQVLRSQQLGRMTSTSVIKKMFTSANFSSFPPPSRRLSQIRRWKKKTRDEMFSEIMEVTRNERAHLNDWKDVVSNYRKDASEREDRRDARDERWRQEDLRRHDATLGLLRDQTDILQRLMELQEQQQVTECRCSPCVTTLTPHHVPYPPNPDM
ncbi:XK-related protein 9 isoform X4 [Gopherus flavomarginatus]|uniref:XK-related protein 9 isoform X4 n=2 Tax=Gopherus flavomarginatus TaxID=286002 RepID=UPI0021CC4C77|nr:XK-related protein 9 isoform X4 [Gopherus flavomarginatus]